MGEGSSLPGPALRQGYLPCMWEALGSILSTRWVGGKLTASAIARTKDVGFRLSPVSVLNEVLMCSMFTQVQWQVEGRKKLQDLLTLTPTQTTSRYPSTLKYNQRLLLIHFPNQPDLNPSPSLRVRGIYLRQEVYYLNKTVAAVAFCTNHCLQ